MVDGPLLQSLRDRKRDEVAQTLKLDGITSDIRGMHSSPRLRRLIIVGLVTSLAGATAIILPATAASPGLSGAKLFVDPYSNAAREAADLRDSNPARAALFQKIATQPQADWVGDWIPASNLAPAVGARVKYISSTGAVPVFVAYAIPFRDCGSYSGSGTGTAKGYRAWVRELAKGVAGHRTAIVLEPDALAQLPCLTPNEQETRLALLADAVKTLTASGATVYIDAGHSSWVPPETMAKRLRAAGVAHARGFSLNVSNFRRTADEAAYGRVLSDQLGGKAFVIDTSRNGLGSYDGTANWCNPPGRALGEPPGTSTGVTPIDAFLWVKRPGESDGTCREGPPAGTWWSDYAAGLAERAPW